MATPVRKAPMKKRQAVVARRARAKSAKAAADATVATAAKRAKPAKPTKSTPTKPTKPASTKPTPTKPADRVDRPRVRGTFAIPETDYARIASLKLLAKRAGFKVKKNELIRLGLRALQALNDVELQARVLKLREGDRAATQD